MARSYLLLWHIITRFPIGMSTIPIFTLPITNTTVLGRDVLILTLTDAFSVPNWADTDNCWFSVGSVVGSSWVTMEVQDLASHSQIAARSGIERQEKRNRWRGPGVKLDPHISSMPIWKLLPPAAVDKWRNLPFYYREGLLFNSWRKRGSSDGKELLAILWLTLFQIGMSTILIFTLSNYQPFPITNPTGLRRDVLIITLTDAFSVPS